MRRCPVLYPATYKVKPIFSVPRSNGGGKVVGTVMPKKHGNEGIKEEGSMKKTEEISDPAVAFSRPPPLPPFIGPLLALSILETCSSRDEDDD
ncbi:PREDICTED: uncharacterized protein LOC104814669 [Tarenaya hassleriana]|uniref:uncharacterized protein LOC104814669 n=1 Tax=Tarenaya hassleriana TaxID=28532 RepID=UPI00053C5A8F|nr:PREDICTED: uncharacterized protein LOC104814669 [Tarenaya hassleriana]XP_010541152.1 PREDICTED: uncharacterized protein LOC104814669 [Tarenaya hassleriana]